MIRYRDYGQDTGTPYCRRKGLHMRRRPKHWDAKPHIVWYPRSILDQTLAVR